MERIPILGMGKLLLVTIQVDMHDRLALALQDDLATRIADTGARGVLIDISALEIVDSFIGRVLATIAATSRVLDAQTVVAVWGVESNFGRNFGKRPLLSSLATLSCFGRRQAFFRGEFIATLKLLQAGDIHAEGLTGSWAGRATTSSGRAGGLSPEARSHPLSGDVSQFRTICLSNDDWVRPGSQVSAGQNREESGVSTSSISTSSSSPSIPNSNLVSAMMMPAAAARAAARS